LIADLTDKEMNMFRKTVRMAAVLAVSALAVSAGLTACMKPPAEPVETHDYQIDMTPYENAVNTTDSAYLKLANKQNPLGRDHAPAALTTLAAELTLYGKEIRLESTAALAAEALVRELRARGYNDIAITSGYRTYDYQQGLFNTYMANEAAAHPDWTQKQCEEKVLTYSARPGTSEHQTGLCIDLISQKNVVLDETFAQNPAYAWLIENAHHFGFILRYPADKTAVTGYDYEPWHYRFVGVQAATAMHKSGETLEEYLDKAMPN
jgi:D-alanyl-D-alanine carboxypeptidase